MNSRSPLPLLRRCGSAAEKECAGQTHGKTKAVLGTVRAYPSVSRRWGFAGSPEPNLIRSRLSRRKHPPLGAGPPARTPGRSVIPFGPFFCHRAAVGNRWRAPINKISTLIRAFWPGCLSTRQRLSCETRSRCRAPSASNITASKPLGISNWPSGKADYRCAKGCSISPCNVTQWQRL